MKLTALEKALKKTEHITPLSTDCGKLCSALCCSGDNETGMYLFSGEEEKYRGLPEYKIIENGSLKLLVCSGSCERTMRPLSCRFYPLFPLIYEDYGRLRLEIISDPRGAKSCPLLINSTQLSKKFVSSVYKCGKILSKDENQLEILLEISDFLLEILSLQHSLTSQTERH